MKTTLLKNRQQISLKAILKSFVSIFSDVSSNPQPVLSSGELQQANENIDYRKRYHECLSETAWIASRYLEIYSKYEQLQHMYNKLLEQRTGVTASGER